MISVALLFVFVLKLGPPEQYPLISSFVAGGMIYVYYEWITNPNGTSLDEMARTLTTLIISGVHAFS